MTDIDFKVGQEHENIKGPFKVLAVKRDKINICWENGEEVTTAAALQNRIIERMQRELAMIRAKRNPKSKKVKQPDYVSNFEGLKEDDFSEEVADGSWRHYDGLGGAVAIRLSSDTFDIASWPRYGLPEIQWADLSHRREEDFQPRAKFFARLDETCLFFGFCIERSDEEEDYKDHWDAFVTWLREAENDAWLNKIVSKHDLSIRDAKDEPVFAGAITATGAKWQLSTEDQEKEIESLADFLDDLTTSSRVDLQIAKTVDKAKVVPRGLKIADDISQLFEVLMPLYEASAVFG